MLYLQLILTFLKIGLFAYGGGYAIAALIQTEVVETHHWLTVAQFTDIMAISQTTPGPIAINSATYVGYMATGSIWGAVLATLSVLLPALVLMSLVCLFLKKFQENRYVQAVFWSLKPTVWGLLASAGLLLANADNFTDGFSLLIFGTVAAASIAHVNPILLLCLSGIAGYFIY